MEYQFLIAKTDKKDDTLWLPLWMHLKDTMGIMRRLVRKWLPESVRKNANLSEEEFEKVAVFLAGIHDIGKATVSFQQMIWEHLPNYSFETELSILGVDLESRLPSRNQTKHAYAGQWILMSEKVGIEVNDSIANVVGAHHGKAIDEKDVSEDNNQLNSHDENYYSKDKKKWFSIWHKIVQDALQEAAYGSVSELPTLSLQNQIILSGLLVVADWIASNPKYFPLIHVLEFGSEDMYLNRVKEAWREIHLTSNWEVGLYKMTDEDFQKDFHIIKMNSLYLMNCKNRQ